MSQSDYCLMMTYQKVIFQMFPVGLLNSIHRALEPHNDQGKGFHFRWKRSCCLHTIGDQFQLLAQIRHQNLSPTKWKPLLKKWFILEVHNKNREYRETNFTWADFWYKLIILTKNKRWQSVTKIPPPTLCHRNPVWEPKIGWGVFHRERLNVFVC